MLTPLQPSNPPRFDVARETGLAGPILPGFCQRAWQWLDRARRLLDRLLESEGDFAAAARDWNEWQPGAKGADLYLVDRWVLGRLAEHRDAPEEYWFILCDLDDVRIDSVAVPDTAVSRDGFAGTRECSWLVEYRGRLEKVRARLAELFAYLGFDVPEDSVCGDAGQIGDRGEGSETGSPCSPTPGPRPGRKKDVVKEQIVERVAQLRGPPSPTPWKEIPQLIEAEFGRVFEVSTLRKYLGESRRGGNRTN